MQIAEAESLTDMKRKIPPYTNLQLNPTDI
jgi:hypothetical protein